MIVTTHAAQRYVERVNPRLTEAEAAATIMSAERAITCAASIGCHVIKMANGAKLMVRDNRVVTVLYPCKPWSGHQFGGLSADPANLGFGVL